MISKTYIAVSAEPMNRSRILSYVTSWIERFEPVEQVVPQRGSGDYTLAIKSVEDVMWERHLQFRIFQGSDFAWVYLTVDQRAIETSSLPSEQISVALDVLVDLEGLEEIVDGSDERRLEELERLGIL